MARTETLSNVPNGEVARVVAEYQAIGATTVVTPNPDGATSTIVATFP
jgi:hypothetical protein